MEIVQLMQTLSKYDVLPISDKSISKMFLLLLSVAFISLQANATIKPSAPSSPPPSERPPPTSSSEKLPTAITSEELRRIDHMLMLTTTKEEV